MPMMCFIGRRTAHRRVGARAIGLLLAMSAGAVSACHDEGGDAGAAPFDVQLTVGRPGLTPGEFTLPRAIDVHDHRVWIADKSGRIQVFDADSGACQAWWRVPNCEAGKPTGLTIAPAPPGISGATAGEPVLYVAHTHDHKVLIYSLDVPPPPPVPAAPGSEFFTPTLRESHPPILTQWGAFGRGPGEFIYPTDVAVLTAADGRTVERIYVGEYGDHDRISVFDAAREFLFSFGTCGASSAPEAIEFDRPQGFQIDLVRRELVVVDARNHRVGRFTLDGALLGWVGSPSSSGQAPGQFRYPWNLALLPDGSALIVEFGNNRLQRIDLQTGECLGTWGRAGRGPGELAQPWALAIAGDRTFVVDTSNHRVQVMPTPSAPARRRP